MPYHRKAGRIPIVTLIDGPPEQGGGESFAALVATHLDRDRFSVWLCVSRSGESSDAVALESLKTELEPSAVKLLSLRRTAVHQLWAWFPLYRLLRRERVQVLHAHKFGSNLWGTIIGRLARVPVVIAHEHSWAYEGNRLRLLIDRFVIGRLATRVVAVTAEDRRRMIEIERIRPAKIVLIPTTIPDRAPKATRDEVRKSLGLSPDERVVVAVGGLRPEKAFDLLIEAISGLVSADPLLRLVVAGEGSERKSLERLIAERGLQGKAMLLGQRADIPDILGMADVGVCCSDREGSPLAVLEYMDAGLPVVATDVGGLSELVEDGRTGVLVEPRDADALAAGLRRLVGDRAVGREMGEAGRRRRRERYAIDAVVGQVEDLYSSELAKRLR